jgi:membrane protease YdiL (CAAX protease family)
MEQKSQFPKPLEAFLMIIISFVLVVLVTQSLIYIFLPDFENINQDSVTLKMVITFGEIGLIIVPLVYVKSKNLSYKKIFRWYGVPVHIIIWSFIIGLSISIIGDELDRLVNVIIPAPEFLGEIAEALKINSMADFIILFFGAVIAATFIEETIIRGFLQQSLEVYQDVTRAVIYSSLAWTIIHGVIYWAIQIFLLGIILGILAWRSNSIIPSIIGHATTNGFSLLFYNINQEKLVGTYLWGNHVSPIFLLLASAGVIYGVKAFYRYYDQKRSL